MEGLYGLWQIFHVLLLPPSVKRGWCQLVLAYRGRRRQDDVSDGSFQLVDVRPVVVRAVVGLDGFNLNVELPGLVLVVGVAWGVKGIIFGMFEGRQLKKKWEKRDR